MSTFAPFQRKLAHTTPSARQRTSVMRPLHTADSSHGTQETIADWQQGLDFSLAHIPIDAPYQAPSDVGEGRRKNTTGLPDKLKTGIEKLSGLSLDDVKVHYNSSKPAGVEALAYTQGTDIHVGMGQERHLAHEAWHVVQQKQGRVQPTMQREGAEMNEDESLEHEADLWGERAARQHALVSTMLTRVTPASQPGVIQRMKRLKKEQKKDKAKEEQEREARSVQVSSKRQKKEEEKETKGEDQSEEEGSSYEEEQTSLKKRTLESSLSISPAHPVPLLESPPSSPEPVRNVPGEQTGPVAGTEAVNQQTKPGVSTRPTRGREEKKTISDKEKGWIRGRLNDWHRRMIEKLGKDEEKRAGEYKSSTAGAHAFSELAWVLEMLNTGRTCVALVLSIEQEEGPARLHLYSNQNRGRDLKEDLERVQKLIDDTQEDYQERYGGLVNDVVEGIRQGDKRSLGTALEKAKRSGPKAVEKVKQDFDKEDENREKLARARINNAIEILKKVYSTYKRVTPEVHKGRRAGKHAELRATDAITHSGRAKSVGKTTLGISKLCCAKCLLALYALQRSFNISEETIFANQGVFAIPGSHLTGYSSDQPLADFLKSWDVIQYVFDDKIQEGVSKKPTSKQSSSHSVESDREQARRLWNADPQGFLSVVRQWEPPKSSYESDLPRPEEPYYETEERFDRPGKRLNVSGKQFSLSGELDAEDDELPEESGVDLPGEFSEEGFGSHSNYPISLALPHLSEEEQMKIAGQEGFEMETSALAPYLKVDNSSGDNDNCLIYSINTALELGLKEEKIIELGERIRKENSGQVAPNGYLYEEATATILDNLGQNNVRAIVVHGRAVEGREHTFQAFIVNPHAAGRTIFIVNAAQIHFGSGILNNGYEVQDNGDGTITFVRQ